MDSDMVDLCERLLASDGGNAPPTLGAWEFVLHQGSIRMLKAAVGVVTRGNPRLRTSTDDLFSAARIHVVECYNDSPGLGYRRTSSRFESWLYIVWKNAVLNVMRSPAYRRPDEPMIGTGPDQRSSEGTQEPSATIDYQSVLEVIHALDDVRIRVAMLDWAAGLNGADSARHLGLSQGRISQLRRDGRNAVRAALGLDRTDEA